MSDTPIQPSSGSVTASGVVAAMAMSLTFAPVVGNASLGGAAPVVAQQTSAAITPTVGAVTLAGVAPTFSKPTVTGMVPTVGAVTLAGVASTVAQQNQNPNPVPGTLSLLYNAAATGPRFWWSGGKGMFSVVATNFNGATVTLNMLGPDGATMLAAATATTLTAAGVGLVELPPCYVQAAVTSGPPTGVYATLARIPTEVG
jgi:hypothetical protein